MPSNQTGVVSEDILERNHTELEHAKNEGNLTCTEHSGPPITWLPTFLMQIKSGWKAVEVTVVVGEVVILEVAVDVTVEVAVDVAVVASHVNSPCSKSVTIAFKVPVLQHCNAVKQEAFGKKELTITHEVCSRTYTDADRDQSQQARDHLGIIRSKQIAHSTYEQVLPVFPVAK
jgi:hypothetical protein